MELRGILVLRFSWGHFVVLCCLLKDGDRVQFWTTDWRADKATVLKAMVRWLVPALLPTRPPMFYRSRWTGFQGSYEFYGLLASLHNLLRPTILHYLDGDSARPAPDAGNADAGNAMAIQDQAENPAAIEDARPAEQDNAEQQMKTVANDFDWAVFRLQMKQKLKSWVQTDPAPVLLVLAVAMTCILQLLHKMLMKGSKNWEKAEKAKVARGEARTFVALECCRQTDLISFRSQISETFQRLILGIPRQQHSQHYQLLLFRLLSSLACATEHYVGIAWRGYPIKLFAALDDDYSFMKEKQCVLCPLSQLLRESFDERTVEETEFKQIMLCLASIFSTEISDVESRHAATRRINTIRSVQRATSQLITVSADWVCRNNCVDRHDSLYEKTDAKTTANPVPGESTEFTPPKPKSHRASSWHAFLSENCSEKFSSPNANMSELTEKFKSLSPEERQRYQAMADLAKLARERGIKKPYGEKALPAKSSEALVPEGNARILDQSFDSGIQLVRAQQKARDVALQEWSESIETALQQYQEDDSVAKQVLGQCGSMMSSNYTPALTGLPGARIHLPADACGEAGQGRVVQVVKWLLALSLSTCLCLSN